MSIIPNKSKMKEIRHAIQEVLNKIAKQYNIESMKVGKVQVEESGFSMPINISTTPSEKETKAMKDLRYAAKVLGFKEAIAGAEIEYGKKIYKIIGLKRNHLVLKDIATEKSYEANVRIIYQHLRYQKSELIIQKKKEEKVVQK